MSSATNLEKRIVRMATQQKVPLGGSLELLPLCNMNCDMCYVRISREEMERKGRLRSVEEWINLAKEMKEDGVLFLLLTGGEPLLYPEFRILYKALIQMGMILTINTNGTLIDKSMADFLAESKPRRVNITLYGKDAKTYRQLCHYEQGFERTLRGIRLLREREIDVKLNGSLTKENKEDLDDLLVIADQLQVPMKMDTYMFPASRERDCGFQEESRLGPEEAAKAKIHIAKHLCNQEEYKEYCEYAQVMGNQPMPEVLDCSVKCRAGRSSFIINWQGKMTPCIMLGNPSVDVFKTGFHEAWKKIVQEVDQIQMGSECASCTKRMLCPVCAASALLETGKYGGVPRFLCRYTDVVLEETKQGR